MQPIAFEKFTLSIQTDQRSDSTDPVLSAPIVHWPFISHLAFPVCIIHDRKVLLRLHHDILRARTPRLIIYILDLTIRVEPASTPDIRLALLQEVDHEIVAILPIECHFLEREAPFSVAAGGIWGVGRNRDSASALLAVRGVGAVGEYDRGVEDVAGGESVGEKGVSAGVEK